MTAVVPFIGFQIALELLLLIIGLSLLIKLACQRRRAARQLDSPKASCEDDIPPPKNDNLFSEPPKLPRLLLDPKNSEIDESTSQFTNLADIISSLPNDNNESAAKIEL
ncbi:hypothetical protein [Acidithrix ferrooxidans]|uniref:Uncharacterized protein n=1 Tax=Acidithrix ferrooxidans TaxID=1280514 RepID=A0A0D8HGK2_9ACTN|nr:hypothetical protein [Acidithrix ferrooxidans]KJF16211.1 hypothetical protein AXFE_29460 [Acidithrix ferrooxidans]